MARMRRMCSAMTPLSPSPSRPHMESYILSRSNTRPGFCERNSMMSNSRRANCIGSPLYVTLRSE